MMFRLFNWLLLFVLVIALYIFPKALEAFGRSMKPTLTDTFENE